MINIYHIVSASAIMLYTIGIITVWNNVKDSFDREQLTIALSGCLVAAFMIMGGFYAGGH